MVGVGFFGVGIGYHYIAKAYETAKVNLEKQGSPMHVGEAMLEKTNTDEYRMVIGMLKQKQNSILKEEEF